VPTNFQGRAAQTGRPFFAWVFYMPSITLYHNPRCSKSRAALALLEARDYEPVIRRYLEQPLSAAELSELLTCLGLSARQVLRTGEAVYRKLNLADESLAEEQLIEALVQHPILLERPILRVGNKAVIGRPPERVMELLD